MVSESVEGGSRVVQWPCTSGACSAGRGDGAGDTFPFHPGEAARRPGRKEEFNAGEEIVGS